MCWKTDQILEAGTQQLRQRHHLQSTMGHVWPLYAFRLTSAAPIRAMGAIQDMTAPGQNLTNAGHLCLMVPGQSRQRVGKLQHPPPAARVHIIENVLGGTIGVLRPVLKPTVGVSLDPVAGCSLYMLTCALRMTSSHFKASSTDSPLLFWQPLASSCLRAAAAAVVVVVVLLAWAAQATATALVQILLPPTPVVVEAVHSRQQRSSR